MDSNNVYKDTNKINHFFLSIILFGKDLRNSDEATCGCPFTIDTTDTKYSMVKVFQNICKTVPGINNNTVANVALVPHPDDFEFFFLL